MPAVKNESKPRVPARHTRPLTHPDKRKSEDLAAPSPKRVKSSEAPEASPHKALFRECMSRAARGAQADGRQRTP